jgi:type IX secretion system PorP/SprF family membrane protein
MKKLFTFLFACLLWQTGFSQNYPVYNQYFNNPFLINPAFVGSSGFTEIGLTHRRQWMGIEGAPVLTSLNIQYPTKKSVSLGLSMTSSQVVSENRTSLQATFGYRVMLGEQQYLRFGLAGGVGNYHLDGSKLEDGSLNDPAVQKLLGSHYFYDGQFGVTYTYKGFNLGFAVPRLFDSRTLNNSKFKNVSYAELKFNLISASYKLNLGENVAVEPYVLYRMGNDIKEKWEGLATIYLKNILWIGGSYRQQYGPTAFAGIAIKNFKVGYSYELPTSPMASYSKGSHEFQLNIRFGKDKSPQPKKKAIASKTPEVKAKEKTPAKPEEKAADSSKTKENKQVPAVETWKNADKTQPTDKQPIKKGPADTEEIKTEAPGSEITIEEKKSTHPLELKKSTYLVVGVFRFVKNAETYKKQLKAKGYTSFIGYSSKSGSFYVYLAEHSDIQDAREERDSVREMELFSNAWIMTVE